MNTTKSLEPVPELRDDDELSFAAESPELGLPTLAPWKLLIVDDEEEVHRVTRLALSDFTLDGRRLAFIDAYSGREAIARMAAEPDIAMVLMDVVMESDHAGLEAVQHIRQVLGNRMTRIVLRTGQPGQAPEREVITRYDINDYRDKTELTSQKLFTLLYTGISLYRDLQTMERNRKGLQQLVDAASGVFQCKSPERLAEGVITLAAAFLGVDGLAEEGSRHSAHMQEHARENRDAKVLATTGTVADWHHPAGSPIHAPSEQSLWAADGGRFYAEFPGSGGETFSLTLQALNTIELPEPKLVDMFCRNVVSALHSAQLHQQVYQTQRELILMLSEAIEKRSRETGNHVRRVGEYSRLLGRLSGMEEEECDTLLIAAPLHDAGKIAIPDSILNKPGRLTDDEMVIMRTHAMIGGEMFEGHGLPVLQAATLVAAQHHERWDGQGYPLRLAGEAIHIYGRIVALADVFDALGSDRCYKRAWPLEQILDLLRADSGRQFDPNLVQLLLAHLDQFLEIRDRFVDADASAESP